MNYPIPHQSADAWRAHRNKTGQNPALIFDRFLPDLGNVPEKEQGQAKKQALESIIEAQKQADKDLLRSWNDRWEKIVCTSGAVPFTMRTDWRLIAGLGRKGPLEVGITFHRYGFPILPGSGIKGVARAWAFYQLAELLGIEGDALEALDILLNEDDSQEFVKKLQAYQPPGDANKMADKFRLVFGTTGQAGKAIFFDAIPEKLPKLELDIINPHYPDYYQGNEPPTNWQSPKPVAFLTVAAEQSFRFAVGWRGHTDGDLRKEAQEWLVAGLTNLGAGGKTSAGYGYFTKSPEKSSSQGEKGVIFEERPTSLKDLGWQKGQVSGDGKFVTPVDSPDQRLAFQREHILPKGYTPAGKAQVEYAIEKLPGDKQRVWVKKLYAKID